MTIPISTNRARNTATDFDDKGNKALDQLVEKYLRRDYSNPMEGYVDAKFKLLKCIDMYHSGELAELVRKYAPHPEWIGDKPAKRKHK
jgi:Type VI secretion system (T6SS), amidase immunity protein